MKKLKGTSILEIVIAAALISMAIIAALSLTNRSQKQNTYARNLGEATKYATQAADWIRTERNTLGWATLASKPENIYCLNELPLDFIEIISGSCDTTSFIPDTLPANIFQRTIDIIKIPDGVNPDTLNITITVSWFENIPRQATIEMELTKW